MSYYIFCITEYVLIAILKRPCPCLEANIHSLCHDEAFLDIRLCVAFLLLASLEYTL